MSTLLTDIEKPGGSGVLHAHATRHEREALALHLKALKAQGHALGVDEVIESGEAKGMIRVTHYLRCLACVGAR